MTCFVILSMPPVTWSDEQEESQTTCIDTDFASCPQPLKLVHFPQKGTISFIFQFHLRTPQLNVSFPYSYMKKVLSSELTFLPPISPGNTARTCALNTSSIMLLFQPKAADDTNFLPEQANFSFWLGFIYTPISPPTSYHQTLFTFLRIVPSKLQHLLCHPMQLEHYFSSLISTTLYFSHP